MGFEIERDHFDDDDYERFSEKLRCSIAALEHMLRRPGFGVGPTTVGAELELHLVSEDGHPAPVNRAVLAAALDERVTLEINRFNVEINTPPFPLAGRPFEAMAAELAGTLAITRTAAREHGADVVMIGVLPTLTFDDLRSSALTNSCRYRALSAGIRRFRGEPATVRIEGADVIDVTTDDVTFEGANTSFQVHLRVEPEQFARTFNAAQIATAFVLAVSANSPIFLGRRLWDETRVALFRQAVEDSMLHPRGRLASVARVVRSRLGARERERALRRVRRPAPAAAPAVQRGRRPGGGGARRRRAAASRASSPSRHGLALESRRLRPRDRRSPQD